jgi:hypothetical protein
MMIVLEHFKEEVVGFDQPNNEGEMKISRSTIFIIITATLF